MAEFSPDEINDLLDQTGQANAAATTANIITTPKFTPDETAKHLDDAKVLGVPPAVVQLNPEAADQKIKQGDLQTAVDGSWPMQKMFEHSYGADVVRDDAGTFRELLDNMEKMVKDPFGGGIWKAPVGEGAREQFGAEQYQSLAAQHLANKQLGLPDSDTLTQMEAAEAQQKMQALINAHDNGADKVGRMAGQFVGMIGGKLGSIGGGAASGAIVGAEAGSVFGPVGATIGGAGGAVSGAVAGFAIDSATKTSGLIYRQLELDDNGNQIPDHVKVAAALAGGTITGALSMYGGSETGLAVRSAITKLATNPTVSFAITRGLLEIGKAAGMGAVLQATMGGANDILKEAAINFDKPIDKMFDTPEKKAALVNDLTTQAITGAITFGALRMPAVGVSMVADSLRAMQAGRVRDFLDEVMKAGERSKTKARSPDTAHIGMDYAGGDTHTVTVPKESLDKMKGTGLADEAQDAADAGQDLTVSASKYAAQVDAATHGAVKDDVKVNDGISVNEGKELEVYHAKNEEYNVEAYHGSTDVIPEFDPALTRLGRGVFFTDDPELASRFAIGDAADSDPAVMRHDDGIEKHEAWLKETLPAEMATRAIAANRELDDLNQKYNALFDEAHAKNPDDTGEFAPPEMKQRMDELRSETRQLDSAATQLSGYAGQTGPTSPNVSKVRLRLGNNLPVEMPEGKFDWDVEAAAVEKARAEGYDSITFTLKDKSGKVSTIHSVLDKANIKPMWESLPAKPMAPAPAQASQPTLQTHDFKHAGDIMPEATDVPAVRVGDKIAFGKTHDEAWNKIRLSEAENEMIGEVGPEDFEGYLVPKPPVEDVVKKAKAEMFLTPLFEDGKAVGMTKGDFNAYAKRLLESQAAADKKLLDATERLEKSRQTGKWSKDRKTVQEFVTNMIVNRPDVMADTYFRTGRGPDGEGTVKVPLDQAAVERALTPDEAIAAGLGGSGKSVVKMLPKGVVAKKGGITPDLISDLFGFGSGKEMIIALARLEQDRLLRGETPAGQLERLINEETERSMEASFGDLEENIFNRALDAVLNEPQLDFLTQEVTALSLKAGDRALTKEDIKTEAATRVEAMLATAARDLPKLRKRVGELGLRAERELLRKDYPLAFQAKQDQAIAFQVLRLATRYDRQAKALDKLFKNYRKPEVKGGDTRLVANIQKVMLTFGIKMDRNPAELERTIAATSDLQTVIDDYYNDGIEIPYPDFLKGPPKQLFSQFSVSDARAMQDFMESMDFNSRMANKIVVRGEKMDLKDLQTEFKGKMDMLPMQENAIVPSAVRQAVSLPKYIDSISLMMERLFDWMDHNDPHGVLNRVVVRPLKAAEARAHDLEKMVAKQLKQVFPHGDQWRHGLNDKIAIPPGSSLIDFKSMKPIVIRRRELISMALHVGNESNFAKLTGEYSVPMKGHNGGPAMFRWKPEDVMQLLDDNMRREDWDVVQGIWGVFKSLLPMIDDLSRRTTGVGIQAMEPKRVMTKWGSFEGGYAPLRPDSRWTGPGSTKSDGLFNNNVTRFTLPTRNYAKDRTNAVYPLDLTSRNWMSSIFNVVHDIAYREALINANKFMETQVFKDAVVDRFGREYLNQVGPWLRDIGNPGAANRKVDSYWAGFNGIARVARQRLVAVSMLGRLQTIMKHSATAAAHTFSILGIKGGAEAVALELTKQVANPAAYHRFIHEKSRFMANRPRTLTRDLGMMVQKAQGDVNNEWHIMTYMGSAAFTMIDQLSAGPMWMVVYNHEMAAGRTEGEAVFAADKAVRYGHGDGGLTSLPAVMRGNDIQKLFTMAAQFFLDTYGQVRNAGRDARFAATGQLDKDFHKRFALAWSAFLASVFFVVLPGMFHLWGANGQSEKKQEGWGEWLWHGTEEMFGGMLPISRDVIRELQGKPSGNAIESMTGNFAKTTKNIWAMLHDHKPHDAQWIRHMFDSVGYATGMPMTDQMGITTEGAVDLYTGHAHPKGSLGVARTLAFGKPGGY